MISCRFFVCLLLLSSVQPTTGAELPSERVKAINQFVGQFSELAMFDGIVAVDVGGEAIYEQSFGFANVENKLRHDKNTVFHLASVSKTLTDVAVARLIQSNELAADSRLAEFLPHFPRSDEITIQHLVSHTSGIPHSNRQAWGDGTVSLGIDEIVDKLAALPLDFDPGSARAYSNGGYAVLAKVLEVVGDGTFDEVMRTIVFEPLGMDHTRHVTDVRVPIPNRARGYRPGLHPGERIHTRYYAIESKPAGGSMVSTMSDMLRFMRAVFREDFVSGELRESILGEDAEGFLTQGRSPGAVAKALYRPADDVIVVSLSNNYAVPSDWAKTIANLATSSGTGFAWPELRVSRSPIEADDSRIGKYTTSYSSTPVVVSRGDRGQLMMSGDGIPDNALIPLEDRSFIQPIYFQRCEQQSDTRVFVCTMLSGEAAYTSTHTPIAQQ